MTEPIGPQDAPPSRVLRVRLLGGLTVEGVSARLLASRKARTVLKMLALHHDHVVSVDRLVDACWPDRLPSHPADQLSVLVSRLRTIIGRDRILFGEGGYRMHLDWLDLDQFHVLALTARDANGDERHGHAVDAARGALALVGGGLLPEDLDASWAEADRTEVDRSVARTRRVAAASALACGRFDDSIEFASAAIAADLYDEEALRMLMLAHRGSGSNGAGLAAYAQVRTHLAEELGVQPSRETEAVYLALLQNEAFANGRPAANTTDEMEDPPVLVGREAELARILDELARARLGHGRLVVIEGESGIGTSALLQAFGRQAVERGATWLYGVCEPLFGGLPMQSVVDALGEYVSSLSPIESAALLAGEHAVLGPLLGRSLQPHSETWIESGPSNLRLLQAFEVVLNRVSASGTVVLAIDDAHWAGLSTAELLTLLAKRCRGLLVVAARRVAVGPLLHPDVTLHLGPLSLHDTMALCGSERAAELHDRACGNPLFLLQLAAVAPGEPLPTSMVHAITEVAATLGDATATIKAAAVLGPTIDLELLAVVLHANPLDLSAHLELARQRGLLDDAVDGYVFHHALVREALATATSATRAALLHREAANVLRCRPLADPLSVANHARLGGDTALAADALEDAAALATLRFDRPAAEELLDQAIRWSDTPRRRLARSRTRTMRGLYDEALADVQIALSHGAGAPGLEAGAWAAYFARRFDEARSYADDGAALADDPATRASCLTVAGRVRHAVGDLAGAEPLLVEAASTAEGSARAAPRVWLGVLRSHQSRPADALELLRAITRVESGGERTTELLHALLFTAHAYALQGRPNAALDALDRYEVELSRRHAPRFAGRASNFRGWILRALGQWERADDANRQAIDELGTIAFPETLIAAHLDLAASALLRNDASDASYHLDAAAVCFVPNLTFGWRLDLRLRLERARLALLTGHPAEAASGSSDVARAAEALGVERYAAEARLVAARGDFRSGAMVDLDRIGRDVEALDAAVGIDSWWLTAEVGRDLGVAAWVELARNRVATLARAADPEDAALLRAVSFLLP